MWRKIIEDSLCEFCRQESESVLHVLWGCGVAQDVWAECRVCLQKCSRTQGDILQLFEELMERLSVDEFELFLVQCWIIWNQQNSVLHGGVIQDPSRLNKRVEGFIKEYREAQEQLAVPSSSSSAQQQASWLPPTGLAYKINFDSAVFAGSNASGIGVII